MKRIFKITLLIVCSLALGAETNSCSISHAIAAKKEVVKQMVKSHEIQEINSWTLTSKFNF